MQEKTFLFYDLETSGLNPSFDQILQFAAIRVDSHLNEIERYEWLIQLSPETLPSPQAMLTHGITIKKLTQHGLPEIDVIKKIHHLFNTPNTVSCGFNTLNFDDEVLRFSFYRNLLKPYTHQYQNGCYRADIYPMVIMYYLYDPSILIWPEKEGKISFKLEALNEANHFVKQAKAHDAMADVEVTLALARHLKSKSSKWEAMLAWFYKSEDQRRIHKLPTVTSSIHHSYPLGLWIEGRLGHANQYQAPVLGLGKHQFYKNQTLWLRLDSPDLIKNTQDNLFENHWVLRKKNAEPGFILPITSICQKLEISRYELAMTQLKTLLKNTEVLKKIQQYHTTWKYPDIPNIDVDAALYTQAFPSSHDWESCHQFHQATLEKKAACIDNIFHPGMKEQAIRIMGRYYANFLPPHYLKIYASYISRVKNDHNNPLIDFKEEKRQSPVDCLKHIDNQLKKLPLQETQKILLAELKDYINKHFN